MAVQFEIESILQIPDKGYYVFAKQLIRGQNFALTNKSFLGGVELAKYLDIPRSTDDKGDQRDDLFVFHNRTHFIQPTG